MPQTQIRDRETPGKRGKKTRSITCSEWFAFLHQQVFPVPQCGRTSVICVYSGLYAQCGTGSGWSTAPLGLGVEDAIFWSCPPRLGGNAFRNNVHGVKGYRTGRTSRGREGGVGGLGGHAHRQRLAFHSGLAESGGGLDPGFFSFRYYVVIDSKKKVFEEGGGSALRCRSISNIC